MSNPSKPNPQTPANPRIEALETLWQNQKAPAPDEWLKFMERIGGLES